MADRGWSLVKTLDQQKRDFALPGRNQLFRCVYCVRALVVGFFGNHRKRQLYGLVDATFVPLDEVSQTFVWV